MTELQRHTNQSEVDNLLSVGKPVYEADEVDAVIDSLESDKACMNVQLQQVVEYNEQLQQQLAEALEMLKETQERWIDYQDGCDLLPPYHHKDYDKRLDALIELIQAKEKIMTQDEGAEQMSDIPRYDMVVSFDFVEEIEKDCGYWVEYDDHIAEVRKLQARIAQAIKLLDVADCPQCKDQVIKIGGGLVPALHSCSTHGIEIKLAIQPVAPC